MPAPGIDPGIYLQAVRRHLRLPPDAELHILRELRSHLQERIQELQASGRSHEEAVLASVRAMGQPRQVAKELYEAHSQGSWFDAAIAAGPHLAVALLFAFHGWQSYFWLALTLGGIVLLTLFGWSKGRPIWVYPMIGYSILPLLVPGLLSLFFISRSLGPQAAAPPAWSWALLVPALPFTIWALASISIRVIQRDWIFGTLMLLPLPAITSWLLVLGSRGLPFEFPNPQLLQADGGIAMTLLALAFASGCFVRLRQRRMKVGVLLVTATAIWLVAAQASPQDISRWGLGLVALLLLGLLLSPALLESSLAERVPVEEDEDLWPKRLLRRG